VQFGSPIPATEDGCKGTEFHGIQFEAGHDRTVSEPVAAQTVVAAVQSLAR
jgi:hypothetical protein